MEWRRVLGQTPRLLKGAALSTTLKSSLCNEKCVRSRLGVASAAQRRVLKKAPPTKKQLDSELDRYMSKTRSRLDQQLDDYMALSRRRLDAELDEYMAMAGEGEDMWG